MAFMDWIRRLAEKMLPKQSLEKKLNVQIATSSVMDNSIQLWLKMYKNTPPWSGGKEGVKSLNLPASIAEEFARLVLTEFDIQLGGSERAEFLQDQMKSTIKNLGSIIEMWCALGGIVLKPYAAGADEEGNPDHIEIDVTMANRFYPTAFDSNKKITGAIFLDTKRIGDYIYTRLEHHNLDGNHYTVINKAFRSERINAMSTEDDQISVEHPFMQEVPLEQVKEWAGIQPVVEMDGVEKPFFVYIKVPRSNNVDPHSPLGASVFSRARDIIEDADRQFGRTLWEYQAKEAAVDADETIFATDQRGKPIIPSGQDRLFRTYDTGGNSEKTTFFEIYSPEIRDDSLFNGLNKMLRMVEFLCGLAYGTLSDANGMSTAERTATEIKYSKQRSFATVNRMQAAWEDGLDDLLFVMNAICNLYNLTPDGKVEKTMTWGDGVLEDIDVEFQRRWSMVVAGKLKLEKFYAWYFGCTEEAAIDLIPANPTYPPVE